MKPWNIIFFTGPQYDDYIESLDFGYNKNRIRDKGKEEKVIGDKKKPNIWWERNIIDEEGNIILKILRTYHPGFFRFSGDSFKTSFVKAVVNWIKDS